MVIEKYKILPHRIAVQLGRSSLLVAAVATAYLPTGATALEIDVGNPDVSVTWGNTMRYNAGWRMNDRERAIANSDTRDEGDYSYDKGDNVFNRFDLLTELDVDYRREMGFRISAAAWKDFAFNDRVSFNPAFAGRNFETSYENNESSRTTKHFHDQSGELLDAFVYKNFNVGDVSGEVKVGRQTVLWGEALILSPFSVSHNQSPIDGLKGFVSPGVDAKELVLPVGQVVTNIQVTPTLTLMAQYYYEWENSRTPQGGTYLGATDFALDGPDFFPLASGAIALRNNGFDKPKNSGDYGLGARWAPEWLDGTLGIYYREFTERSAVASINPVARTYEFFFPEHQKLIGLSLSKSIGGVSVGAEVTRQEDAVLNTVIQDGTKGAARGTVWTGLLNGVKLFGPNQVWDSASLIGELGYSYLEKVTENERYFDSCYNRRHAGDPNAIEEAGCSSRDNSQIALRFTPGWTAVFPGWDTTANFAVTYGISGNSPLILPDHGQQGVGSYQVGNTWTYNARHDFSLAYVDYLATNQTRNGRQLFNGSQRQDRGWLSFTYKASF